MIKMYGYKKEVKMIYVDTVERVRHELTNDGFGVLTQVDMKSTLRKVIDSV